jgi:hypothetical protein
MISRAEFWSAVDADLDARRDPFASVEVRSWALEHPEDALELADLRAALREAERADNPLRAPRRSRLAPLAAAAGVALLAGAAWFVSRSPELETPKLTAVQELMLHPVVPAPELCRVQSWEVVSTTESADGTIKVRASEGRLRVERRTADSPPSAEGVVLSSESLVMR